MYIHYRDIGYAVKPAARNPVLIFRLTIFSKYRRRLSLKSYYTQYTGAVLYLNAYYTQLHCIPVVVICLTIFSIYQCRLLLKCCFTQDPIPVSCFSYMFIMPSSIIIHDSFVNNLFEIPVLSFF